MVADEAVPSARGSHERGPTLPPRPVRRLGSAGVALVIAVSGCGSGTAAGRATTSTSPAPVGATTPSTVPVPPELAGTSTTVPLPTSTPPATAAADDLAATTAIAPLDGFGELPPGPGTGALDLAGASGGDARERDALNRFRFRDGYARGFAKGAEEIVVTVLRFSSAADAAAYLQDTVDSSLVSNGSFLFSVPVPGATGYREQGAATSGQPFVTYGALFARGDRCFEQLVRGPATGPERSEADAQALARRQADRVGG
jgi:hypothetical protein